MELLCGIRAIRDLDLFKFSPSIFISPLSGAFCPCNIFNKVDLPAPFGPTSAVRVPALISTDTLFKAGLLFLVYE